MAFLAVDQLGNEYIFNNQPTRLKNGWCSFELNPIKLPYGSILRLSGLYLTFEDAPFEMVTNNFRHDVCVDSGCRTSELKLKTRKREVVQARQFIMAYNKIYLGLSLASAAAEFGKDHATCCHSIKTIQNLYSTNRTYREQFKDIFTNFPLLLKYKIGEMESNFKINIKE
jgi:hypothetical protein